MRTTVEVLRGDFLVGEGACPVARLTDTGAAHDDASAQVLAELRIARGIAEDGPIPATIAIGAFDGVHRGHRYLLERAVEDAHRRGELAVAVTFDPDPDEVVAPAPAPKLLSRADRLRALALSGVDLVLAVEFTPALAALDHAAFVEGVLGRALCVRAIHVGSDFRMGARGASTVTVIEAWGAGRGIDVHGHHLVLEGAARSDCPGHPVITATRIREEVAVAHLGRARRMLGRWHFVRGTVVHGRGEGTGMGFPTANLEVGEYVQLPCDGVYAGWALVGEGRGAGVAPVAYPAAINVGVPPMFAEDPASARLEAVLLGYSGDLYGSEVALSFVQLLRAPLHFDSIDALVRAVRANMDEVRALLGDRGIALTP